MAKSSGPVRGMNAALASGEAGVGEIKAARTPLGVRQTAVALVAAVLGVGISVGTYHAIATRPLTFSGEVTPAHAYYLNFPNTGTVQTLAVRPGEQVKPGQVLATQVSSVAAANLSAAQAAVVADTALVAEDKEPQTTTTQLTQNQLSLAKAQAAATSAQGALSLAQNSAQNSVAAQTVVVNSDQTTLDNDNSRYAQYCADPATAPAPPPTTPAANAVTTANATPAATAPSAATAATAPNRAASPAPSASTADAREQYCQSLQSQLDKDSAALAQARADLGTAQSSGQAQQEQDEGTVSQSQSVLQAAQAQVAAQGTALTPSAIAQAESQLASAQAQLAAAQLAFKQTSILAPAAGIVADTAGAAGDIVGPEGVHSYAGPAAQSGTLVDQEPGIQLFVPSTTAGGSSTETDTYSALVTVYSGALTVTAQLPESEMASVHIGQSAELAVTAIGATVSGQVSQIPLDPARVPNATYYDVSITLDTQRPDILAGMSVNVTLG